MIRSFPIPCFSLRSQFAHHGHPGGGADAVGAGVEHEADVGQGADAPRSFYTAASSGYAAEKGNVGRRGATRGEAGGGLKEVSSRLNGDFGGAQLFLHGEQVRFKYHFKDGAVMM